MRLHLTSTLLLAGCGSILLAGCGSSWDIRKGDALAVGCIESNFYPDGDSDGWGDPGSDAVVLCEADANAGLTASNKLDCDDADESITGKIGTACPVDVQIDLDGMDPVHAGILFDQSEFMFLYGPDTNVAQYRGAQDACESWGKTPATDPEGLFAGTLATFSSQPELAAVLDALQAEVEASGTDVFAGFIGVYWDGPDASDPNPWAFIDEGEWRFTGDGNNDLIQTGLNWCNGEVDPWDFFPLLAADASQRDTIAMLLPDVRLALVLQESGLWCLGTPEDAGEATAEIPGYNLSDGHFVCRRSKPSPADYVDVASPEDAGK